jgi:hypothetical protein
MSMLPFKRIAVTVPPGAWFHGISRALYNIYRGGLAALGLEIFEVPIEPFLLPDVARIDRIVSDLRRFRPELAFGLPKGSGALLCRLPATRDGWRPNLFTEVLEIPSICLWDHAPLELANQLFGERPVDHASSMPGALDALRRFLTHPRLIHWSPDTGQTEIMRDLGFLLPDRIIEESLPCLPEFQGAETTRRPERSVAFIGHFYQERPNYQDPALQALAGETIQKWIGATHQPIWYALREQIDALDSGVRQRLALDLDQTHFWNYAHRLALHDAQTALRLKILGSAGVPITCYGDLKMKLSGVPPNLVPIAGEIPFGPELAERLTRHTIAIDVFNPGSAHGFSHKPMLAFGAGGFMLVDRKRDFIAAFGAAGEAVSYTPGSGDLAGKIARFLDHPKYLREVGDAIRETIRRRYLLKDVLRRVLQTASRCVAQVGAGPAPGERDGVAVAVEDLLPGIQKNAAGSNAYVHYADGAASIEAPEQWSYAAEIGIPASARTLHAPCLRVTIRVETGRFGIAPLLDTGMLFSERHVSATGKEVALTIELPSEGASHLILRNSDPNPSRAVLLEALLLEDAREAPGAI